MPKHELGEVVAERHLLLRSTDGVESPVYVAVGRPRLSGHDWLCPYEIEFQGDRRSFAIYGLDSVQALVLTMKTIDVELEVRAKQADGVLLWHGEPFHSLQDP